MQAAQRHFSATDLATFRVCKMLKLTLTQFQNLSEYEQTEWLAYDRFRQNMVSQAIESMREEKDGKIIVSDAGAYMALHMERW